MAALKVSKDLKTHENSIARLFFDYSALIVYWLGIGLLGILINRNLYLVGL